jgi:hypothetical protein
MVIQRAESDEARLNVSMNDRAESVKRSSRMVSMLTVGEHHGQSADALPSEGASPETLLTRSTPLALPLERALVGVQPKRPLLDLLGADLEHRHAFG